MRPFDAVGEVSNDPGKLLDKLNCLLDGTRLSVSPRMKYS